MIVKNNNCGDFVFMSLQALYMREILWNKFKNKMSHTKTRK
jgi:hypothetical protein